MANGRRESEPIDLTRLRFGRLKPIKRLPGSPITWECMCDCGNITKAKKSHLIAGFKVSCGCRRLEAIRENGLNNAASIIGKRFGSLTVVSRRGNRGTQALWEVLCDCGETDDGKSCELRLGRKAWCKSCARKALLQRQQTHGYAPWSGVRIRAYPSWQKMLQRCNNPNDPSYANYGGRGIKVCDRWHKFENFLADMGDCPPSLTLGRKDNDGPYCKENCGWETAKEQANNKRGNTRLTYLGVTYTLSQLADYLGVAYHIVQSRYRSGWSVERIATQPVKRSPTMSSNFRRAA